VIFIFLCSVIVRIFLSLYVVEVVVVTNASPIASLPSSLSCPLVKRRQTMTTTTTMMMTTRTNNDDNVDNKAGNDDNPVGQASSSGHGGRWQQWPRCFSRCRCIPSQRVSNINHITMSSLCSSSLLSLSLSSSSQTAPPKSWLSATSKKS